MHQVQLRNSAKVALIDDGDVDVVAGYRWRLHTTATGKTGYAVCRVATGLLLMHRLILGSPSDPTRLLVDHKNCNGLDNRRSNLRWCNRFENASNRHGKFGTKWTSRFIGVYWHLHQGRWVGTCRKDGKKYWSKYFKTELEAAFAYDDMAFRMQGEFATLNFPERFK